MTAVIFFIFWKKRNSFIVFKKKKKKTRRYSKFKTTYFLRAVWTVSNLDSQNILKAAIILWQIEQKRE